MEGWVKLHRKLLEKPIWKKSTPEHKTILITILLMANHKENEWEWQGQKFKVKAGQFVTSLDNLARESGKGITVQNVRTALKKFETYEFLTNISTKEGRLITIVNWGDYQCANEEANKPINKGATKEQQRSNKEVTSNKKDKNGRMKEDNIYTDIITYLNEKAGKSFKPTTGKTKTCINARLNEGFTIEDFKKVIDIKVSQWANGEMSKYLRPETLFGTKFEGYLNEGGKNRNGFNDSYKRTEEETTERGRTIDFNEYEV